jgi:hypothetical protein
MLLFVSKTNKSFAWLRSANFNIRKTSIRTYRTAQEVGVFLKKNYSENESGGVIIWPDLILKYFRIFFESK